MKTTSKVPANIDEYIAGCPKDIQLILEKLRVTIRNAAPGATEAISYQMPTFKQNGNLVHFAVHKNHIGFYPAPSGIDAFKNDLKGYVTSKGAIQFPLDQPLPFDTITKIVLFRVEENRERSKGQGTR